jgi:hypothetical protein
VAIPLVGDLTIPPSERKGTAVADSTEFVTIRHPLRLDEKRVPKSAVRFFPDYVVLDAAGRKSSHQPTNSTKES